MQTGRSHKKMWASPVSGQMTKQVLPFPVGQLVTNSTDSFDSLSKLPVGTTDKREGVSEEFSEKLWCGGLSVSPGVMGRQNSPVSSTTDSLQSRSSREWHAGLNSVPLSGLGCCWESKASYSPLKMRVWSNAHAMSCMSCFQYCDSSRLGIWEETRS